MNSSNRMFLFINCGFLLYSVRFTSFLGLPGLKWVPCGPFNPNFNKVAVDIKIMCKTGTVQRRLFLVVSRLRIQNEN
jgi:hypothetical protein